MGSRPLPLTRGQALGKEAIASLGSWTSFFLFLCLSLEFQLHGWFPLCKHSLGFQWTQRVLWFTTWGAVDKNLSLHLLQSQSLLEKTKEGAVSLKFLDQRLLEEINNQDLNPNNDHFLDFALFYPNYEDSNDWFWVGSPASGQFCFSGRIFRVGWKEGQIQVTHDLLIHPLISRLGESWSWQEPHRLSGEAQIWGPWTGGGYSKRKIVALKALLQQL